MLTLQLKPPKSVVTEPSSKTSLMARASSGAMESTVILSSIASGRIGRVLVTTTSLILLAFSRSGAGSESTACVAATITSAAPASCRTSAALVIVMSVMNGVRSDLFDKIVGLNGHAVVQGFGGRLDDWQDMLKQAKATPGVVSATPLIEQPLLGTFSGRVEGILVRGMTVGDIRKNETLNAKVLQGSLTSLTAGSGIDA